MARGKVIFEDFQQLSSNVWLLDQSSASSASASASDSTSKRKAAAKTTAANGSVTTVSSADTAATIGAPAKQQPELVILATWMSADARHITKYVLGYRQLFPCSSFLIIRNGIPDVTYRPRSVIIRRLQPAFDVVERFTAATHNRKASNDGDSNGTDTNSNSNSNSSGKGQSRPNIMLHMYSNGGANQARILAQLWRTKYSTPLPISSLIFDSCPGLENYRTALAAFVVALPQILLLRYVLLPFIHMVLMAHYVANHFFGALSFLRVLRRDMNDDSLFPKSAPRCYIYSKGDEMVAWRDVESHAEDARQRGWAVTMDRFDRSKHVSHLIANKDRYWDDVQGLV